VQHRRRQRHRPAALHAGADNHGYPPQQTPRPWSAAGLIATLHNTPFAAASSSDNSIARPRRPAEYDSIEYGGLPV